MIDFYLTYWAPKLQVQLLLSWTVHDDPCCEFGRSDRSGFHRRSRPELDLISLSNLKRDIHVNSFVRSHFVSFFFSSYWTFRMWFVDKYLDHIVLLNIFKGFCLQSFDRGRQPKVPSARSLIGSLWAKSKVITLTEWFN